MERKDWLTIVYREANYFLERHKASFDCDPDLNDPAAWEPLLDEQLQEILAKAEHLEDFVKFSLRKELPAQLWRTELEWERVLIKIAGACLLYDVAGVICRIVKGELPRTPSQRLVHLLERGDAKSADR